MNTCASKDGARRAQNCAVFASVCIVVFMQLVAMCSRLFRLCVKTDALFRNHLCIVKMFVNIRCRIYSLVDQSFTLSFCPPSGWKLNTLLVKHRNTKWASLTLHLHAGSGTELFCPGRSDFLGIQQISYSVIPELFLKNIFLSCIWNGFTRCLPLVRRQTIIQRPPESQYSLLVAQALHGCPIARPQLLVLTDTIFLTAI